MINKEEKISIAFADDHVATRIGIITYLEANSGVKVDISASDGAALIQALKEAAQLPQIVIVDIEMQGMNGFDTVRELRQNWPNIKILVLTAFETELYTIAMIRMGVNGYLLKREHPSRILEAINNLAHSDFYYSSRTSREKAQQIRRKEIKIPSLTDNELEYLRYCVSDLTYADIAKKMNTTIKALDGYSSRLSEKLKVKGRIGLAMAAVHLGLIPINFTIKQNSIIDNKKI